MKIDQFWDGKSIAARCNGQLMSEGEIIAKLKERSSEKVKHDGDVPRRKAAVLVPILCKDGIWQLLFTRRTDYVPHHKGQVSFPGGAQEPEDESLIYTALRETCEEIGLHPRDVRIIGQLEPMPSVSNYLITPVVGRIIKPFHIKMSEYEVSRVFSIPLEWLSKPENREIRPYRLPDGRELDVIYYKPFDGEILWGATAYMTVEFLKRLGLTE